RAGRSADLHARLCPGGAEYALRERPWRDPSRGPAQTAVDTTAGWTGRRPRSPAGRRTVTLEPHGQALGLTHGLLSLNAPDFSPGDVYRALQSHEHEGKPIDLPRLSRQGRPG